jgi:hypothetical protein
VALLPPAFEYFSVLHPVGPGQPSLEGLLLVRRTDAGGRDWSRADGSVDRVGAPERLTQPVGVPPAAAASAAARCRRVGQTLELDLLDEFALLTQSAITFRKQEALGEGVLR